MKRFLYSLLFTLLILAAACSPAQTPDDTPTASDTPAASATPGPTDTPTPPPGKAILLTAGSTNPELAAQAEALINEKAGAAGMVTETRESLQTSDLTPELKLVVALAPPANLAELTVSAPQTQFVVISNSQLEPSANLTVIEMQAEQQAFVAGLISTLISNDWRSAGLIPAEAANLQTAFTNGGGYFCGLCSPGWPLGVTFPLVMGAAAPGDGPAWTASAADLFDNGKVEVFYLSAAASLPEVAAYLAGKSQVDKTVKIVGELPPPDELRAQWGATVKLDPMEALGQALPTALAGSSAGKIKVPVSLTDINPDIFSPGRLQLVQSIMDELERGIISPSSVPEQ